MSITDELREYANGWSDRGCFKRLIAIADCIDERHAKARDKAYDVGVCDGIDADKEARGYIKLPVDADGEIWTGNERVFEVGNGTRYDMRYLMYDGEKWIIDSSFGGFIANECRHHREPTVEDVLREFAQAMSENMGMYTGEAIDADEWRDADNKTVAEYAAKLRLAGDE